MDKIVQNEIERELARVLENMDVPKFRFKDIGWLKRNIHINNSNHPNILLAQWLIRNLTKA